MLHIMVYFVSKIHIEMYSQNQFQFLYDVIQIHEFLILNFIKTRETKFLYGFHRFPYHL